MPSLVDLLDDASSEATELLIHPTEAPSTTARLWSQCLAVGSTFEARFDEGTPIGLLLATSTEAVTSLVGGWLAGLNVASLPFPRLNIMPDQYVRELGAICDAAGIYTVFAPPTMVASLARLADRGIAIEQLPSANTGRPGLSSRRSAGEGFVQFTSGTTTRPRGAVLTLDAMAACVQSTLSVIDPRQGETTCSWLPLSHDMGLVGMLLTPWIGLGPAWAGRGRIVLLEPDAFLRSPRLWLRACSDFRATITTTSPRGIEIGARSLGGSAALDLSSIRCCLVGGDRIDPELLRHFGGLASCYGFRERAVSPAYGLAEATLTVSMVRPDEPWTTHPLDLSPASNGGTCTPVVSAGPIVPDIALRIGRTLTEGVGEIEITGPSLFDGYLGEPPRQAWFRTGDVGMLDDDGGLFVVGRLDDFVPTSMGLFYAPALEERVARNARLRGSRSVVLSDDKSSGYLVIIEEPRRRLWKADGAALADWVASCGKETFGTPPSRCIRIPRGVLPLTHSGKIRRSDCHSLLDREDAIDAAST